MSTEFPAGEAKTVIVNMLQLKGVSITQSKDVARSIIRALDLAGFQIARKIPMKSCIVLVSSAMLFGCATTPTGPTTNVLPGPHKSLATFTDDDVLCRHFAEGQVAGEAAHAGWMQAAVAGGGTLLGAGIGAAAGGGHGALLGGAAGALGGATVGGLKSGADQQTLQQRYDIAYGQCQVTRGNRVPVSQRPLSADRGLVFR